ncbi:MAG: methionine adenosyltransferase [bacterium]|nr:methionine adenosyltransferase [bacterium]
MRSTILTSESVAEGHPDKVSDQISDAVVDAILREDPTARVACETLVTTGLVVLAGEVTTRCEPDYDQVARQTIREIGYDDPEIGFDYKSCAVVRTLGRQSPDIAQGVDTKAGKEQGAGDQGMMFGFACRETPELMPLPIMLAHRLVRRLAQVRKRKVVDFLRPDGKSQVSIRYREGKPVKMEAVVMAVQHTPTVKNNVLKELVIEEVVKKVIPPSLWDSKIPILINHTGRFVVGGPHGDTGLTGRKIIVDTYGGHAHHGGGAFSGKDPSKVDRSASYMARYIAKNVVAAGLAERVEVQFAYVIGRAEPIHVSANTFGTGKIPENEIEAAIHQVFSLKPAEIIKELKLLRPIYRPTAAYGHFGRTEPEFTWEHTDRVKALQKAVR